MSTVAIVYHSGYGHTQAIAEAVAAGAHGVTGVKTTLVPTSEAEAREAELDAADAIVFGSPTYMGGVSADFAKFKDWTSKKWMARSWQDKLAAGFTVSASPSGDKLSTLQYFNILAAQHGMLWVGLGLLPQLDPPGPNYLGAYLGAIAQAAAGAPGEHDLATGRALGERVAGQLRRLHA